MCRDLASSYFWCEHPQQVIGSEPPVRALRAEGAQFEPNGRVVDVRGGHHQSVGRNGTGFSGVAVFDAGTGGVYQFDLESTAPTTALVTRSLTDLGASDALWIAAAPVGGLLFLGGGVSALIGFFRKREFRRCSVGHPPTGLPPLPPRCSAADREPMALW